MFVVAQIFLKKISEKYGEGRRMERERKEKPHRRAFEARPEPQSARSGLREKQIMKYKYD